MKIRKIFTVLLAALLLATAIPFSVSAASNKLGDVNGNGKIDSFDYMMLKKYVLKTGKLTDDQKARADVDGNGKVNSLDYTFVKKHVLKTYVIVGEVKPKTATEKIVATIGSRNKISLDFEGQIGAYQGTATVSFVVTKGVLSLQGHAVTEQGMVIDMTIPLSKVSEEYAFNGTASVKLGTQAITGECVGSIVAATYSIDQTSFDEVSFTASIPLNAAQKMVLETNCKGAMDQFLYQANLLLAKENTGVTIGDLGFTNYLKEINDGGSSSNFESRTSGNS